MTNEIVRMGRLFENGAYTDLQGWVPVEEYECLQTRLANAHEVAVASEREIEQLNADKGHMLTSYTALIESSLQLTTERDHWLEVAREKDAQIAERDQFLAAAGRATQLADERAMEIEQLQSENAKLRGTIDRVENQLFALASGLEGARQRRSDEPPADYKVIDNGAPYCMAIELALPHPGPSIEKAFANSPRRIKHTTEDDFQHFLSYSKLSDQPAAELHHLRLAYYAGADKQIMGAGQGADETRSVAEPVSRPGSLNPCVDPVMIMDLETAQKIVLSMGNGGDAYKIAFEWNSDQWRLDDDFTADQLEAIAIVMRTRKFSDSGPGNQT